MTESLNTHRRNLMGRARKLARQAQDPDGPGLIRGDLIGLSYETLLDTCIEVLRVCPPEVMVIPPAVDVVPCGGCDRNIPVERSGRRYCSEACRKHIINQAQYLRRAAA